MNGMVKLTSLAGARLAFSLRAVSVVQEAIFGDSGPHAFIETLGLSTEDLWEVRETYDTVMERMREAELEQLAYFQRLTDESQRARSVERVVEQSRAMRGTPVKQGK